MRTVVICVDMKKDVCVKILKLLEFRFDVKFTLTKDHAIEVDADEALVLEARGFVNDYLTPNQFKGRQFVVLLEQVESGTIVRTTRGPFTYMEALEFQHGLPDNVQSSRLDLKRP